MRSYIGNGLTRYLYRVLIGQNINDTQTGMRGVPKRYVPGLLRIESNGYEFELDMLILYKHSGIRIVQCSITTLYENNNAGSHFNPLRDSMRIYFVLLRFSFASLSTSAIDYLVFWTVYQGMKSVVICTVTARIFAVVYNYLLVKRHIFYSNQHVLAAKFIAESGIFIVNFLVQRDLIFTRTSIGEEAGGEVTPAGGAGTAKGCISSAAKQNG